MRSVILLRAAFLLAGTALGAASGADVTITKPYIRWLFGGFGFQNSEANFVALMPGDVSRFSVKSVDKWGNAR